MPKHVSYDRALGQAVQGSGMSLRRNAKREVRHRGGYMSAIRQSRQLHLLAVAILVLTVAACASSVEMNGQESSWTEPFLSQMQLGEGVTVEWSGYARGHQSGEESPVDLTLHNGSQGALSGLYCIQLLDRDGIVATLTREEFSLQPGESWARQIQIRVPSGLAAGDYALALAIPGRLSNVTTIQVGKEGDAWRGPWPEPVCQ